VILTHVMLAEMLTAITDFAAANTWVWRVGASVGVGMVLWAVKVVLSRGVRRADIRSGDLRRRWLLQVRNLTLAAFVIALTLIWASELRNLAFSIAAILVAIVIALKEIILCFMGGFMKMGSGAFGLGDRICVGDAYGDVIDQTLLTTTLMEIGNQQGRLQYTGRKITIPNLIFVTAPVTNESYFAPYTVHTFAIPVKAEHDWQQARQMLLAETTRACADHLDAARKHIESFRSRYAVDTPNAEPRVTVNLVDPGRVDLVVRVIAPDADHGRLEQRIIERFMAAWQPIAYPPDAEPPNRADQRTPS